MMGQVHEQERPSEEQLEKMTQGMEVHGDKGWEGSWTQAATGYLPAKMFQPSMPSWSGKRSKTDSEAVQHGRDRYKAKERAESMQYESTSGSVAAQNTGGAPRSRTGRSQSQAGTPQTVGGLQPGKAYTSGESSGGAKKVQNAVAAPAQQPTQKKKPRKLEVRSSDPNPQKKAPQQRTHARKTVKST